MDFRDYTVPDRWGGECTWMGATWIPTNYMVFRGLIAYGHAEVARALAEKTFEMVVSESNLREYYNGETGSGQGLCPFWGWSSLGYVMLCEVMTGHTHSDPGNRMFEIFEGERSGTAPQKNMHMQNPLLRIRPLFRRWVAWCWATVLLPLGLPAAEAPLLAPPASPTVPPPLSFAYAPTSAKAGFAAGEVILRCGEPLPDSFLLHWGDAEGKLPGHAPFAPVACTGETTRCRIADCIALPSGATRLLAWSVKGGQTSESAAEAPVPASARREWEKTGTAYEMQVVSDTHVRTDRNHLFTRHFQKALQDIAAVSPDSIGVFVVGDLTDNGTDAEYETYLSMVRAFDSRLPGHSHWELNSPNTMFSGAADFPVCFNTASVGYTWNDGSQKTGIGVNGSEGYYLEAKEDGLLLVRGRDFENGLWLPSAQFIVEPAGCRQRGGELAFRLRSRRPLR